MYPSSDVGVSKEMDLKSSSYPTSMKGVRAINRDMKALVKQNLFEFELPNEDDIFTIDLNIKCGGMWEGMSHKFRAKIAVNYPFSHPMISCLEAEKTFHPNIQSTDGSICLEILSSEGWKPMYTLTDVCVALTSMFISPNWDHYLNQECFDLFSQNKGEFHSRLVNLGSQISYNYIDEDKSVDTRNKSVLISSEKPSNPLASESLDTSISTTTSTRATTGDGSDRKASLSSKSAIKKSVASRKKQEKNDKSSDGKSNDYVTTMKVKTAVATETNNTETNTLAAIAETVSMMCGHYFCGDCWNGVIEESVNSGADC